MTASQNPTPRIRHLDGLRGVAIALVLIHHFVTPLLGQTPGSAGAYAGVALTLSYTGVDLFFVLSGFLIGGILLDHRTSPHLVGTFYRRRAFRILPLSAIAVTALLAAFRWRLYTPVPEGGAPWPWFVYMFFGTNVWMAATADWGYRPLSHLWSLAIEEQFYLAAPFLTRATRPGRLPFLLAGFVLFAAAFRLVVLNVGPHSSLAAGMLPFGRMDGIGAGMFVAWLVRQPAARTWCANHERWLDAALALAVAGCLVLTKLRAANGGIEMAEGGYTWVALSYALVVLILEMRPGHPAVRILSAGPLVALGRYSYFLYLFQGAIIGLTVGLLFHRQFNIQTPSNPGQLAAGLCALVAVAHVSWKYFESPLTALGRKYAY